MYNFQKLNLNPIIINALEKKGYLNPTPIQVQAIPHLLAGKDLLGIAQTGTGKTAAFSLPILDRLSKSQTAIAANQIRALILTPTRELATQIAENIELYGKGLKLKHAVIFGGVNEIHQIKALKTGLDIVIATPGRLLDLTNQGYVNFSKIEIFVLDEADRMLDMGFINDIKKIISMLPQKKQSLLFSATMPDTISKLVNSILNDPVKVEITPQSTTVERINQKVYMVDKSHKAELLLDVVIKKDVTAALVFCKTKHGANKVVSYLEQYGVSVSAIHGNKSQTARERALKDLRVGKIKVLIATDIAARGIDVVNISHVINYDITLDPESYVHRIGRTARAGREGVAISFCDASEKGQLQAIEKAILMKIPVDNSHPFYKKVQMRESTEKKILSREAKVSRFSKKAADKENITQRNQGNKTKRDRTGASKSEALNFYSSRNQKFSKPTRSNRDRFLSRIDDDGTLKNRKSTAKKIFKKTSSGSLEKNINYNNEWKERDSDRAREIKNKGKNFRYNKKTELKPFSKVSKKPFGKNRKPF